VAAVFVRQAARDVSDGLVDLLDRLVDTGISAGGDVTLAVAGVELIQLRLQALLASIGTEGAEELAFSPPPRRALPERIDARPESLDRGLAQLVLVVVELLGELMERQALRRMAAGTLTDEEVRRLGEAFSALHDRIEQLTEELVAA
jgi:gas vesicle protein GvpK/gas vesicle protein GvpA/GvpJ/GvpM family